ncbi:MAG TPA: hypothetical protein VGC54_04185 [Planctomycetota bacterium]
MRFEIRTAYVVGVLLPLAEAARRRTDFSELAAYVDDFLVGGLLLLAAHAARTRRPAGNALLVAAWAVLCGGLYYSFFGQLERGAGDDISGLSNFTVVVIKGLLYALALYSLARSIRATAHGVV